MSECERVRRWHTSYVSGRPKSASHVSQRFQKPKVDPSKLYDNASVHANCSGHWGPVHAGMIVQKRTEEATSRRIHMSTGTTDDIGRSPLSQILLDLRRAKRMDDFATAHNENVLGWERRRWLAGIIEDRAMRADDIVRKRTAGHRNLLMTMLEEIEDAIDQGDEECVDLTIECLAKLYYSICCDDAPVLRTTKRAESAAPLFRTYRNRYWTRVDPENPHFVTGDGLFLPPEEYNIWDAVPPPSNLSPTSSRRKQTNSGVYYMDPTPTQQLVDSLDPEECADFTRTFKHLGSESRIASKSTQGTRTTTQTLDNHDASSKGAHPVHGGSRRRRSSRVATPVRNVAHRGEILFKTFRKANDPGDLSPSFSPFLSSRDFFSVGPQPDGSSTTRPSAVSNVEGRAVEENIRPPPSDEGQTHEHLHYVSIPSMDSNIAPNVAKGDQSPSNSAAGERMDHPLPHLQLDVRPETLNTGIYSDRSEEEVYRLQKVNQLRAKYGFPLRPTSSIGSSSRQSPLPGTQIYKYDTLSPTSFFQYSERGKSPVRVRPSTAFARLRTGRLRNTSDTLNDRASSHGHLHVQGRGLQSNANEMHIVQQSANLPTHHKQDGSTAQLYTQLPASLQNTDSHKTSQDLSGPTTPISTVTESSHEGQRRSPQPTPPYTAQSPMRSSQQKFPLSMKSPLRPASSSGLIQSPPRSHSSHAFSLTGSPLRHTPSHSEQYTTQDVDDNVTELYQDDSTWIRVSSASRNRVRPCTTGSLRRTHASYRPGSSRGTKDLVGKTPQVREPIPLATVMTPSTSSSITRYHIHNITERRKDVYNEGRNSGRRTRESTQFGGDGVVTTRPWTAALLSS